MNQANPQAKTEPRTPVFAQHRRFVQSVYKQSENSLAIGTVLIVLMGLGFLIAFVAEIDAVLCILAIIGAIVIRGIGRLLAVLAYIPDLQVREVERETT